MVQGHDYTNNRYNSNLPLVIDNVVAGKYSVVGLNGTCNGKYSSEITINNYTSPSASISGLKSVCSDGTDIESISIKVAKNSYPAKVVVSRSVGGDTNFVINSEVTKLFSSKADVFTLKSLIDVNGCKAQTIDLSGAGTILSVQPPTATLVSVNGQTNFGANSYPEHFTITDLVEVVGNLPSTGYSGSWLLSGQGEVKNQTNAFIEVSGIIDPAQFNTANMALDTAFGKKGVSKLIWTVSDNNGICSSSEVTLKVVKVTRSFSNAGKDSIICISNLPFERKAQDPLPMFETTYWVDIDGAFNAANTKINSVNLILPTSVLAGKYRFKYVIENTKYPSLPSEDIFELLVNELPSTATSTKTEIKTCDITAKLTGVSPALGTGIWTKVSGTGNLLISEVSKPDAKVSGLKVGESGVFKWTTSNGACKDKSSTEVTVLKSGILTPATISINSNEVDDKDTVEICITATNQTLSNTGFIPASEIGVWSVLSGTSLSIASNNSSFQIMGLTAKGTTEVKWEVSDISGSGCAPNTSTVYITIVEKPNVEIISILPSTICQGESQIAMVSSSNALGLPIWNTGGSDIVVQASETEFGKYEIKTSSTASYGDITLSVSVNNPACGAVSDDIVVLINKVFDPKFEITPILTQCQDNTINFSIQNGTDLDNVTYAWNYTGIGVQGIKDKPKFEVYKAQKTEPTAEVTLIVTSNNICNKNGKTITKSTQVKVKNVSNPSLLTNRLDTTICQNNSLDLYTTNTENGTSYQWYKNGEKLVGEITSKLKNVNNSGIYYMLELDGICSAQSTDTIKVKVDQLPLVNAGEDVSILEGDKANINGFAYPGKYLWSIENSTNKNNVNILVDKENLSTDLNTTKSSAGSYDLLLTSVNGKCSANDRVTVVVKENIRAPNVFTVNGDGNNEYFIIQGIEYYPKASVNIFNRWGDIVYQVKANYASNPWDGGSLPEGVYYYIVESDELVKSHTGVVHLLR